MFSKQWANRLSRCPRRPVHTELKDWLPTKMAKCTITGRSNQTPASKIAVTDKLSKLSFTSLAFCCKHLSKSFADLWAKKKRFLDGGFLNFLKETNQIALEMLFKVRTNSTRKWVSADWLHTLKHTDGCSRSWLEVGLCCRWISRRRRREEQKVTLVWELGSWCTVQKKQNKSQILLYTYRSTNINIVASANKWHSKVKWIYSHSYVSFCNTFVCTNSLCVYSLTE